MTPAAALILSQGALLLTAALCAVTLTFRAIAVHCAPTHGDDHMRGMQRLANVMHNGLQEMDDEAGKVADEFVAAKAESETVIAGFKAHVGDIRAATQEVRSLLSQLTNGGPTGPLPDTAVSPVAAVPT